MSSHLISIKPPKPFSSYEKENKILSYYSISQNLLLKKYSNKEYNYAYINTNYLIFNEKCSIVSIFKDYLIYDDSNEFLRKFYSIKENNERLKKIYNFYSTYSQIFPNYLILNENIFLYRNIRKKQRIIDQYNKFWYIKSSNLTNEIPNLNNNNEDKIEGIQIITFSDTFSKITFGYNVLTFYMAFVLLVGNYLRSIFLGSAERVIYTEMVLPNKLLNVCEGIRISRIKKDYLKEEQLYYLLIDLMRSPEMIKKITKSSLIFIQENNINRNNEKKK